MGLYICIFDDDEEIDGVEVGSYADYNALRDYIVGELEAGKVGSRFPTFVLHSDCDGEWSPAECEKLWRNRRDHNGFKGATSDQIRVGLAKTCGKIDRA